MCLRPRALRTVVDPGFDRLGGAEQQTGVDIALHADVFRQASQGFSHVHRPVEGNDVDAGLSHPLDHPALPEM